MIDFSTPVKPLGLKVNLVIDESYNRGLNFINGAENVNNSFTHRLSLTLGNKMTFVPNLLGYRSPLISCAMTFSA
jgi:hypothetical protein